MYYLALQHLHLKLNKIYTKIIIMSNIQKTTKITEEINWIALEAGSKRSPNPEILSEFSARVYNHEPYAMDFFKQIISEHEITNKEPIIGERRKIQSVVAVNDKEIIISMSGFINGTIDLKNEKSFCARLGLTIPELVNWLNTENGKNTFLSQDYHVIVEAVNPNIKVSISRGEAIKMRAEFFDQIKKPTAAYYGKIMEKNGGGFIINVSGMNGFLPGSLAAANIVRDFDSMIGKEIPVVVEDYLKDSDTFVFSYKKYINMILPTKIAELNTNEKYTGTVTGVAKYGIFVEFEEIFTGLIHTSKMTPYCREQFNSGQVKPGTSVEFWIKEITPDKKIILTDEDPSIRRAEIEEFKEKNLGTIKGGEVISVQPFGTLVKLQKDIVGLISQKEIKSKKKNFNVGDNVMVTVDRIHNDKIFLSLPNES
jgi:ribosomal protein S1